MKTLKDASNKLNGKKMPMALVTFIVVSLMGYGALKERVEINAQEITNLRPAPGKIVGLEVEIQNVKKSLDKLEKQTSSGIRGINTNLRDTNSKIDQVLLLLAQK